ncbi:MULTISPECIES: DUF433 domain-containing protein [unclassified Microcoleus]|uniref:DUF433 domain-containing protein n=1 Tax=unclassified Microcoleus TaxID=2642155 RepID=UPI002FD421B1
MPTLTDIGTLITRALHLRGGIPIVAGTATSVQRIAALYKQANNAEEIAADLDHLTLAQVYAALTYYQANQAEIEANLAAEQAEYERLAALNNINSGCTGINITHSQDTAVPCPYN